ncbi:MAG: HPP family protein [Xanthobacteraceae bacterium]|nr:HPP family protein [Xanthobacteraceae bacterium]
MSSFARQLFAGSPPASIAERLRAGLGALVGILVTGIVARIAFGGYQELPYLIPPMGASAVLLFGVPASPLAQPWSIVGGNLIAGLVGVTAARYIGDPAIAGAVALALAIPLMFTFGCVHPPSGAVALTAVLSGPAIHAAGYGFILWPLGVNTILIVFAALAYNNLTGRRYPHAITTIATDQKTADALPLARVGFTPEDIDAALKDYGEFLDIDRSDIESVMRAAEVRAFRRRSADILCRDIMSRDVLAVSPGETLKNALYLLRSHHIKALPVTDEYARVVGILTQSDFLNRTLFGSDGPSIGLGRRLNNMLQMKTAPQAVVSDIMTAPARSATPETPVADLLPMMANGGLHHLPVVDEHGTLAGVVTQSDVIAALFEEKIMQAGTAVAPTLMQSA